MAISLEGVSDQELVGRLKQFVGKEQKLTHRIILHLAELDRRRLYASLGYSSLFDYCTRGLGYAPASAQRRIKAARAIISVPEVYDCLEGGKLSLGVIETVADALAGSKGREIFKEICGKTRDEARRIVACYHPVSPLLLSDRIEPIVVKRRDSDEFDSYFRAEVQKQVGNDWDEGYRITFAASTELKDKLDQVQELVFGRCGPTDLAPVLERVLDEYIARYCPEARAKKRAEREQRRAHRVINSLDTFQTVAGEFVPLMPDNERDPRRSRYVSDKLREEILARDGYCCSYVADDGTKCGSRVGLQIDHIEPFAYGGETEPSNLRTVCRTHNLMFARESFGEEHIAAIIARRKPGKDGRPTVYRRPIDVVDPAEKFLFE